MEEWKIFSRDSFNQEKNHVILVTVFILPALCINYTCLNYFPS